MGGGPGLGVQLVGGAGFGCEMLGGWGALVSWLAAVEGVSGGE